MQRMFNMDQWKALDSGETLDFVKSRPRGVVLEVNSMQPVLLFLTEGDDTKFVARYCGRDTITFTVNGPFKLSVEPADGAKGVTAWIYTAEGQTVHTALIEPEIFTRMHQRQERDPEAELLRYRMQKSMQVYQQTLMAQMQATFEAKEKALVDQAASIAATVAQQPPSANGGEPSSGEAGNTPAAG